MCEVKSVAMTKDEKEKKAPKPGETWRIVKNVVVISVAFMLHFTAYSGAANLQSSINAEAGLGTASLAAVYAGLVFSNIFLPVPVIKWMGTKWAMSLSFITYMPYMAAQLWPRFYTMIPAGLMVGLGGGPLWCAKCTYISVVSEVHSQISNIPAEALLVRFLGMFFMIFQMNQVWGNLISSLVLSSSDNAAAVTAVNETMIPILCGANFLPSADAGEALQAQPQSKIQTIAGIYLACMAGAALIVAVGVDSMKRYDTGRSGSGTGKSGLQLLAVTLRLLVEPNQLLLIVINIFIGMQQAFFGADFTASFVSCAVGTGTVGFVMMVFGLSDAIGCIITGYLAKISGRIPLIIGATIVHTGLLITLLSWQVQAGSAYVMYGIAVLWGLADSVWMVQINAYYGILFPGREEAAFSNFRLWESVGYIIAYVISPYLRTSAKTVALLVMMVAGVVGYFTVEIKERKVQKKLVEKEKELGCEKGCDNIAFQSIERWMGTKWTMTLSFITYMPYMAAQLWPRFYTMIPAGLMVGLGGGPLWCAKCTYISVVSEAHSQISNIPAEALLVRFLGMFFMIFQMSQVWGNLISSLVLSSSDNAAAVTAVNETMIPILCGANFLPSADAGEALQAQPQYDTGRSGSGTGKSGLQLLAVTLRLLVEPNLLLLIVINIFIGMQQAFFGADFTASFVSCAVGTGTVGFVMMVFGLSDAIGCIITGYLAKVSGRIPLIIGATIVHTGLLITLLSWQVQAGSAYVMYGIAVLWGLADSVWMVQITAYYGILFPGREEAAFSNFRLWESVGFIITYVISPYLRTSAKTVALLVMMVAGVVGYFTVEIKERKMQKKLVEKEKELGCDNIAFQSIERF